MREIKARNVFDRLAAGAEDPAVGKHDFEPEYRIARHAIFHAPFVESVNADYTNELGDNGPRYPGAAELSLTTAQWVAFYNRERPHRY